MEEVGERGGVCPLSLSLHRLPSPTPPRPSWSLDEPHKSDRISPKVPPQDLPRQWLFLVLIIIFAGLPADQIARLQRIQHNAARLVMKKRRRNHVTPLLKEHHRLPVKFRCQYKIATLLHPSALMNHLTLSDLQKKNYL